MTVNRILISIRYTKIAACVLFLTGCTSGVSHIKVVWQHESNKPQALSEAQGIKLFPDSLLDARDLDDPNLVGQIKTGHRIRKTPVKHQGDLIKTIQEALRDACTKAGFTVVNSYDDSELSLITKMHKLWVYEESGYFSRHFNAEVELDFRLVDCSPDSTIWTSKIHRQAENHGDADAASQNERTLNKAFNDAIGGLFGELGIETALSNYHQIRFITRVRADSLSYSIPPLSRWSSRIRQYDESSFWADGRLLQFYFAVILGGAAYEDLTHIEDTASAPFGLGRSAQLFQFRSGTYLGPFGFRVNYELYVKPWVWLIYPLQIDRRPDDNDNFDDAYSSHLQVLGSFGAELYDGRIRLEPVIGYGWRNERATTDHNGTRVRDNRLHLQGMKYGIESVIRFNERRQLRTMLISGEYRVIERSLNIEHRWTKTPRSPGAVSFRFGDANTGFLAIGYRTTWRGDGRRDHLFYLGAGLYTWLH